MRKDTTKKFLAKENRFFKRFTSIDVIRFVQRQNKKGLGIKQKDSDLKISYDLIEFRNCFALEKLPMNTISNRNILLSSDKIKNVVSNKNVDKQVSFNMVYCESGTFTMGDEDLWYNKPRIEIIENSFLLGETEVTQELYEKVMEINPSYFKNPQNPVENVSWYDAIEFCNKLSQLQGLDGCYVLKDISTEDKYGDEQNRIMSAQVTCDFNKNGYRLPKEKEWEYAAKAGTQNRWAGTNVEISRSERCTYDYVWFRENSYVNDDGDEQSTHPVATKLPNEWGFYDMSGNVAEWCWDKHETNKNSKTEQVIRGGGYAADSTNVRSASRYGYSPDYYNYIGFRICRTF